MIAKDLILRSESRYIIQKEYWLEQLAGELAQTGFTPDFYQVDGVRDGEVEFVIPEELAQKIGKISKQMEMSVYLILLTALKSMLYLYTGKEDLAVVSPIYKQKRTKDTLNNFVVLRNQLQADLNFKQLLMKVRETALQAYKHQDYPFTKILEELQIPLTEDHLFDLACLLKNIHEEAAVDQLPCNLIFAFTMVEGGLQAQVRYNSNRYQEETIQQYCRHFIQVLEQLFANPETRVQDLVMLSAEEEELLLRGFNQTQVASPVDRPIHLLFEEQVTTTPDHTALVYADQKMTYAELNYKANQVARLLRKNGVQPNSIVGILAEPSLAMLVGVLGILKAGGGFLPISPELPAERINFMLEDCAALMLLVPDDEYQLDVGSIQKLALDDAMIAKEDGSNLSSVNQPTDLVYLIYTSGTTGRPKGVELKHHNLVNYASWFAREFVLTEQDRSALLSSFAFDLGYTNVFPALLQGAEVHIVNKEIYSEPKDLLEYLGAHQITYIKLTPSLLNMLVHTPEFTTPELCSQLRLVVLGGEAIHLKAVERLHRQYPEIQVVNHYGPTEATIGCIARRIDFDHWAAYQGMPTIGKPVDNLKAYILDEGFRPLPIGAPGMLYIAGEGLARGYFNHQDLTDEKFVKSPFGRPGERMYKTGDVARWLPDGNIQFLGRSDHQVKIRGFRVELGEIEAALMAHTAVQQVVVTDDLDPNDNRFLAAYLVMDETLTVGQLREYLAEIVPEYMIPSYFVQLKEMPLNANGKVDRRALPDPTGRVVTGTEYEEPRDEREAKLVEIWQEVLGVDKIGIQHNFFELGGHSLLGTILAGRIHKELDVVVPLRVIFKTPTIKGISEYIAQTSKQQYQSIEPIGRKEYYQTSSAQKRMYLLQQLERDGIGYNMPTVLEIIGQIDLTRLEQAFEKLIARHETLRTSFEMQDQEIVQKIHTDFDFQIQYLTELTVPVDELVHKFVQPFQLDQAPLLRVGVIQLERERHLFMLDLHHIISDGVSTGILIDEFSKLYTGDTLPELRIQYKDFSEWQDQLFQSSEMEKQKQYWTERFAGEIPVLNLPTDFPRPAVQSYVGDLHRLSLDAELTGMLKELTNETGTTMYMLLLAAVNILLAKYSGQEDLIIGSTIAGRPHADLEQIIGMFVNTLAMRNAPEGEKLFTEFLQEVKDNALGAFEHQDYPFEELVDQLSLPRDISRNPLFDVMFEMHNIYKQEIQLEDLVIKDYEQQHQTAKFDLSIVASEQAEEIELSIEYCTKLFKRETIEQMGIHLQQILRAVTQNQQIKIKEIEMLTEAERTKLLVDFTGPDFAFDHDQLIFELFEEWVEKRPDKIALEWEAKKLTYRELNQRANQMARYLRCRMIGEEELVGILLDRSPAMVESILGTWKSGGAYIPIDPAYPTSRISGILNDSGARILITRSQYVTDELRSQFTGHILQLDECEQEIRLEETENLNLKYSSSNLAYTIYTSGSTGKPKGAMVEHLGMMNHMLSKVNELKITEESIIVQNASHCFDISVWQFFSALICGGKTLIYGNDLAMNPRQLISKVAQDQVTILEVVPSFMVVMLDVLEREDVALDDLEYLLVTGEELKGNLVRKWFQLYSKIKLVNAYGPTEASDDITHYIMDQDPGFISIPIGYPVQNFNIYVVDQYMQLCPIGVKGEIVVSGIGVGRGYLNDPERTEKVFLEDPFQNEEGVRLYRTGDLGRWSQDGFLEFFGRIDFQVKIRGFRIELGEIESRLLKHNQVKEAVVMARDDAHGNKYLCAYVVGEQELSISAVKEYLGKELPDYMVPAFIIQLAEFPLNPNGKINRKALPEPEGDLAIDVVYQEPTTEVEKKLVAIWEDVLGLNRIGVNYDFFEIGGNSINMLKVTNRINQEFGVEISLSQLFVHPTIEAIAKTIYEENSLNRLECIVRLNKPAPEKRNLFIVHGRQGTVFEYKEMAKLLEEDYNFYGIQARGLVKKGPLPESVEELVAEYIREMKVVQPEGPYLIGGYCHGMIFAYDMTRMLEKMGDQVEQLVIIDEQVYLSDLGVKYMRLKTGLLKPFNFLKDKYSDSGEVVADKAEQRADDKTQRIDQPKSVEENLHYLIHNKYKLGTIINSPIYAIKASDSMQEKLTVKDWSKMTNGTVRLSEIPGDHESILRHPDVVQLALAIKKGLQDQSSNI